MGLEHLKGEVAGDEPVDANGLRLLHVPDVPELRKDQTETLAVAVS